MHRGCQTCAAYGKFITHVPNATIHLHYNLRIEMEIKADHSKQVAAARAWRRGKMCPLLAGQIWILVKNVGKSGFEIMGQAWLPRGTYHVAQYPLNIQSEWMSYSTGIGEVKILRQTGALQAPF